MIVAGVVIQTLPGRADAVSARLAGFGGLAVQGTDNDGRVAAVWNAADADDLTHQAESLIDRDSDVVGVYPTFVGQDVEGEA